MSDWDFLVRIFDTDNIVPPMNLQIGCAQSGTVVRGSSTARLMSYQRRPIPPI